MGVLYAFRLGVNMIKLEIEMLFREEHEEDVIYITVNKQRFILKYHVAMTNKDGDYHRERASAFGEKLMEIGASIQRQAEHGKPGKHINENTGHVYITF